MSAPTSAIETAIKIRVEGVAKRFDQSGQPVEALAHVDLAVREIGRAHV